jgi:hypothetical protein
MSTGSDPADKGPGTTVRCGEVKAARLGSSLSIRRSATHVTGSAPDSSASNECSILDPAPSAPSLIKAGEPEELNDKGSSDKTDMNEAAAGAQLGPGGDTPSSGDKARLSTGAALASRCRFVAAKVRRMRMSLSLFRRRHSMLLPLSPSIIGRHASAFTMCAILTISPCDSVPSATTST